MRRTERWALVLGSIGLLALTALGSAAALAGPDEVTSPSSRLPASPAAFAERAAGRVHQGPMPAAEGSLRDALELLVLVATCGIAVALYSAAGAGRT